MTHIIAYAIQFPVIYGQELYQYDIFLQVSSFLMIVGPIVWEKLFVFTPQSEIENIKNHKDYRHLVFLDVRSKY